MMTKFQTALQYAPTAPMKKKNFIWYHWMTNTGPLKKHLKELFVYTNMDYHITYANIHALMGAITFLHTWTV